MKKLIYTLAILFIAVNAHSQTTPKLANLQKMNWLQGKWMRTNDRPGTTTTEAWEVKAGVWKGVGMSVKGSDTVSYETMTFKTIKNILNLEVLVGDSKDPVNFKVTKLDADGFTAENPDNDFPQVINYKRDGDLLVATISGGANPVTFRFKKG